MGYTRRGPFANGDRQMKTHRQNWYHMHRDLSEIPPEIGRQSWDHTYWLNGNFETIPRDIHRQSWIHISYGLSAILGSLAF